jgi:GDPmannose 4,6-dehydratase
MKAIITGISGQDGHYAARHLLALGYAVVGLSSDAGKAAAAQAEFAGEPVSVEPFDFQLPHAIDAVIERVRPALILNFAAKSTGVGMFDAAFEMARLNGGFVLDILEAIRRIDPAIGFCQASSAEMYGDVDVCPQDERTCFRPKSPYGAAKLYAHNLIGIYRRAFGLRCSSAILYNHESVRRTTAFVTRKIARAAAEISLGRADRLVLGGTESLRDWGYAPEYAEAVVLMALADRPADYVLATGQLTSVAQVCDICFSHVGLDYRDHLVIDASLKRPIETTNVCGDASAIARDLGWKARTGIRDILVEMVDFDRKTLRAAPAPAPQNY